MIDMPTNLMLTLLDKGNTGNEILTILDTLTDSDSTDNDNGEMVAVATEQPEVVPV